MSRHLAIIRVAAVTVVKVAAVKELVQHEWGKRFGHRTFCIRIRIRHENRSLVGDNYLSGEKTRTRSARR